MISLPCQTTVQCCKHVFFHRECNKESGTSEPVRYCYDARLIHLCKSVGNCPALQRHWLDVSCYFCAQDLFDEFKNEANKPRLPIKTERRL